MALAEDVWIEIFVRLRVRSLLVAICVCKRWYSLIKHENEATKTTSYFTRKHLEYQNKMMLLQHQHVTKTGSVYSRSGWCSELNCVLFDDEGDDESSNSNNKGGFLLRFSLEDHKQVRIDGPVNGLYCVCEKDAELRKRINGPVIWNPATNEAAFLPSPHLSIPEWSWDPPWGIRRLWLGLDGVVGFGNHEDDYKVILLYYSELEYDDKIYNSMLYTTATNTWRLFDDEETLKPDHTCLLSANNTFLNGFYYWKHYDFCAIVFDMTNEVFREISTPCRYGRFALHHHHIYIFDVDWEQNEIHVWMMLEESNNNDANWIKKIYVRGIQEPLEKCPLGFWKTENELILVIEDMQTVLYNIATRDITNLMGPKGHYPCGVKASDYNESLVSLRGGIIKYKGTECATLSDKFQSYFRFSICKHGASPILS